MAVIGDLGRPLTNRKGIDDLALLGPESGAGARMAKATLPPELSQQGTFEDTPALDKQTAIDRLVRHLHIRIAREGVLKPAGDLLW